jgi:hypothetical protein
MKSCTTYVNVFLLTIFMWLSNCIKAQAQNDYTQVDSFSFQTDSLSATDSLFNDSSTLLSFSSYGRSFGLLDSIVFDSLRISYLKPYLLITGEYVAKTSLRKNLPTTKEIKQRPQRNAQWKFWVILFIFAYIALVRIANPNNFKVFLLSVFNLKLSDKIWEEQRSFFGFVILQLFAIYLFVAAMFINTQMELKQLLYLPSYFVQFLVILGVLLIVYLFKFIIHAGLGSLLNMNKLGVGFVSNHISVNNFLALVLWPLVIFIIYNSNSLFNMVITRTVIAVFFISVLYRCVRIILLSNRFFSFPLIYLFIYLCALEIAPWFVIIKFINTLPV